MFLSSPDQKEKYIGQKRGTICAYLIDAFVFVFIFRGGGLSGEDDGMFSINQILVEMGSVENSDLNVWVRIPLCEKNHFVIFACLGFIAEYK